MPESNNEPGDSRPKVIALFKSERPWCHHARRKLALTRDLTTVYALPLIRDGGFNGLLEYLNELIDKKSAERVYFFIDFFFGIDHNFISRINPDVIKILVTLDDITLHRFNRHTALACDLVLTADPISVLKYEEAGITAGLFLLESSKEVYQRGAAEKTTDVLFFGNEELADRSEFLAYLRSNNIAVRTIGGKNAYLDVEELVGEICRAKIVLNFSKTGYINRKGQENEGPLFFFQFKGRIVEAGLCGSVCISESGPALRLMFDQDELPLFRTKIECFDLVEKILHDDKKRADLANRLYKRCIEFFEDEPLMLRIEALVDAQGEKLLDERNKDGENLPIWYRKRVLRARIQLIWHRRSDVFREIHDINRYPHGISKSQGGFLIVNTLCWGVYDRIKSLLR